MHDAVVKSFAETIASISSGVKNISPQMETLITDSKTAFSGSSTSFTIPSAPFNASNTSNAPSSSSSPFFFTQLPLPQLSQEDFLNIRYWAAENYICRRKIGKNSDEDDLEGSILSSYMEDENGNPIQEQKRAAAHSTAKKFFSLLLEQGQAPTTWRAASIDIDNELIHMLESDYPFLRLCDNHWKARQVATNSYSQWYPKASKRRATALAKRAAEAKQAAGTEVIDIDDDDTNQDQPPKRPRAEDNEARRPKRPRVEETKSIPPHPTKVTTQH